MLQDQQIETFLAQYEQQVATNVLKTRKVLFANLPGIMEQIDEKAKMIAYCYGQKYVELICVLIPSEKGLKLGFNRGNELPDPYGMLQGKAKISRYIEIKTEEQINSTGVKALLLNALALYKIKTMQ